MIRTIIGWSILLKLLIGFFGLTLFVSCSDKQHKVLIFSKTEGFRHQSIEEGVQKIKSLLEENNLDVQSTENADVFNESELKDFAAVIFLNTTGNVLDSRQQADFERYIQAGGGFVGIHAATDTEYQWPWFNQLVGAYFDGHPQIQDAQLNCVCKGKGCCGDIPKSWKFKDEWYNFRSINPGIEVIMEIDESSYEGGTNGGFHPMVWKHHFDGGRAFYTGMGHRKETFHDPLFMNQLFSGIQFAIGNQGLNYAKATTQRLPDENRFSKQILDFNLDEPMELDQLGDQGIIYVERKGAVKLFEFESNQIVNLDTIPVHYANEDGLLGVAVDPDYKENQWVYFFYSPDIPEAKQYISRFTLDNNQLTDEKILLEIPLIRKCCHSGGSLEFGADSLLYIGVGDNTNPFESSGFAPIDERPGRQLFDAQRSASNTNDLRGKILRIKPESDGTYSIPPGNLFPEGMTDTRPEIFVMGCRNPFRFSIDSKTNFLYWGDVGPDSGAADSLRGPAGMGEYNQAKQAGYYGWPYSRGNNQMYVDYNFADESSGEIFDANRIINNSPNNTGIERLPPIRESMIWYSYKSSDQFAWLGSGGVNPMSGPIYHADDYELSDTSFPSYFENKWFVYEWMRDWIYVVELDKDHQFVQADPFMPGAEFSHPMDMLFAKDGKLYVLEYGQKWNNRNLDARLSVIQYNPGNRAPQAHFTIDKTIGAAPLIVQLSGAGSSDADEDELIYEWRINDELISSNSSQLEYTLEHPGIYEIELIVKDPEGNQASTIKKVMVGNEIPEIKIHLTSDNTTYWKGRKVEYQIEVRDAEDGSSSDGTLPSENIKVTFNYLPEGEDKILASLGHQQNVIPEGLRLINASGCKACHAIDKDVAGPSYQDVAQRYSKDDRQMIMHRIKKGSQGIWGERMMAPHPQLKLEEVQTIVDYILSLDSEVEIEEVYLPLSGALKFDQHLGDEVSGKYILMASYQDKGHPDVAGSNLATVEEYVFIPPRIELEDAEDLDKELGVWQTQGRTVVGSIRAGKEIKFAPISFDHLASVSIGAAFNSNYNYGGEVEVRQGSSAGRLLGSGNIGYFHKEKEAFKVFEIDLQRSSGLDSLFLVFKNAKDEDQYTMNGDWIQLNYNE